MLVIKTSSNAGRYLDLTEAENEELIGLSSRFTKETILSHCKVLDNSLYTMQRSGSSKRTIAEMALVRLCDESLDPSGEALLSRVSKLEDMIRYASFSSHREEKITEPITPPNEPEIKPAAESKPTAPTASVHEGKKKLKTLRCKMEVADKLALTDIPASSFLKSSTILETESKSILIKAPNDFALTMLSRPKTRDALCISLSSCLGREIGPNDLTIEVSSQTDNDSYDIIDELLND